MMHKNEPYPDPLIDEVRQRRRDLFDDCGKNLQKLGEAIRERQARHPDKLVDRRRAGGQKG